MIRILIPVYNEGQNIKNCVIEVHKTLRRNHHLFYLVNDGSRDSSLEVMTSLSKKLPIKIINHKINKGVAAALQSGLTEIVSEGKTEDVVIIMEGDGTSSPTQIKGMIKAIRGGRDVVIASRYIKGGKYQNFPTHRLILSYLANRLLKFLFPYPGLQDYTNFFRAYSLRTIKRALRIHKNRLITTKYFTANTEFLIKILTSSTMVSEIPFVYDYGKKKGKSGLSIIPNLKQYFKLIFRQKVMRER